MHDTHFLDRLSRVSRAHCEVALELYRNPALVAHLLRHARRTAQAERYAIALDSTDAPPHVVVAENGHFVTCLAKGMTTNEMPVVAHADLLSQWRTFRDRQVAIERMNGSRAGGASPALNLYTRGAQLSMDDAEVVFALGPLVGADLLRLVRETFDDLRRDDGRWARRVTARNRAALEGVSRRYWLMSHLALALGTCPLDTSGSETLAHFLVGAAVLVGSAPVCWRALWTAARIGEPGVPIFKKKLLESRHYVGYFLGLCGLMAVAARHPSLRTEILELLAAPPRPAFLADHGREHFDRVHRWLVETYLLGLEAPEDGVRDDAPALVLSAAGRLPDSNPFAYRREEDVPADIGVAVLLAHHFRVNQLAMEQAQFVGAIPYVVQCEAKAFFLRSDAANALLPAPTAEHGARVLADAVFNAEPHRVEKPSAPNAPCTCGSGKKFKRCCGLAA